MEQDPTLTRLCQVIEQLAERQQQTHHLAAAAALRATQAKETVELYKKRFDVEWQVIAERVTTLEVGRDERFALLRSKFDELRSKTEASVKMVADYRDRKGQGRDGHDGDGKDGDGKASGLGCRGLKTSPGKTGARTDGQP